MTIHPIETIVSDPQIREGQVHITGSRVRVLDVVASHLYRGLSPDELATNFSLNLGQIYAALAFYYQHKSEMDDQLRQEANQAEQYLEQLEQQGKLLRYE